MFCFNGIEIYCLNLVSRSLCYRRFFLPHGLTVDHEDNLWLTDVGSHQVCKVVCYVPQCPNSTTVIGFKKG